MRMRRLFSALGQLGTGPRVPGTGSVASVRAVATLVYIHGTVDCILRMRRGDQLKLTKIFEDCLKDIYMD